MSAGKTITLISSDNQSFTISFKAASRSKLVKDMCTDYEDQVEFPMRNIHSSSLSKIIEYLEHYQDSEPKEIPKPLKDSQIETILDEWDLTYINSLSKEEAFNIVNATNLMDISSLNQLCACKIAAELLSKNEGDRGNEGENEEHNDNNNNNNEEE